MSKPTYSSFNPFFIIPALLWFAGGGILLATFTRQELFTVVNLHYTAFLDIFMYYATWMGEGGTITVALLVLIGASAYRNWWYFTTAVLCTTVPSLVTRLIKNIYAAPRPFKFYHKAQWIHFNNDWGERLMNDSFPSGHTTGAFSMFCLLSLLLPQKYRYAGLLFFGLALLTAYSRMYLAAHFFADIYAGSVIGTTVALCLYAIMKHYQPLFFKQENAMIN